ncbi:AI-2E family transporter [Moraxella bovis]|uniref:AI-2E family transporter n=1 Tax=Moraxella bovis TaxID=476 RepID=UPI002227F460|nr:AI-2E family transporter [Moraxella bovis]UYZ67508.1 AI-2E family transporter [Moraxella bovis]UYZ69869.1 AI-2E family transporter [Moraxella bovis]UYZ74210.1 AI-2E family transporter [Moraxella bovis]UZA13152.1 AI-2E family transporter [Moraxella bovis]UZA28509.1 AI-2E family transporter [Moraxella bovis]
MTTSYKSAIVFFVALVLFLMSFYYLIQVWLMVFASILVAVFLLSLAQLTCQIPKVGNYFAKLPHGVQVGAVTVAVLSVVAGFLAMFGSELVAQFADMKELAPKSFDAIKDYLKSYPAIYEWLTQNAWAVEFQQDPKAFFEKFQDSIVGGLPAFFGGMLSGVGTFFVILVVGLFLALSPSVYTKSAIALVPKPYRDKGEYLLKRSYGAIEQWLIGQFVVMAFVGVATGVALWLMGIPFALAMGVIAFVLDFVPVIGPWLSAVPILLLVLIVSPDLLLWTLVMIVVVQQLESYVVAPMVQQRLIDLPPVALLLSQIIMGTLTGVLGVAMATPLMVVAIVWVQVAYVKFVLQDYSIKVLDQNENDMKTDPYADYDAYKAKSQPKVVVLSPKQDVNNTDKKF